MPEDKPSNPFEDHINSTSFDLSRLDEVPPPNEMDLEMQAFFDNLPETLNHELWDTELDDRQKIICAYLTTEMVNRVMRVQYAEELQDLTDEQLHYVLSVPVTLAMLAEEQLHHKPEKSQRIIQPSEPISVDHPNAFVNAQPLDFSELLETLKRWFYKTKEFFARLLRRL